jgi:hypothetical protein
MVGWGFSAGPPVTTNGVTTRTVAGLQVPGSATTATVVNSANANQAVLTTPLAHFFEIIATAVAGTTNQFMFQFAIDGIVLPGSFGPYYFAAAGDTGSSHLLINLPRTGNWTVIDDIYVTTMNGTNNVGQLGVTQVLPTTTISDAQAQYTRSGSQASDAAAVAGPYSNSEGYVYATGVGTKDIYNTSSPVPPGYRVRAVQVEAFFSKYGATGATATVGLVSGATELDSAPVGAYTPTPVYAAVLADTDPNTGTAWTVDAAKAVRFAVTKAS